MIPLLLRFIDDMFGIVIIGDSQKWKKFEQDLNNFWILKWELEDPCQQLDYLDVTLTLKDGKISSKSYQKPTSLYQYICPNSAHPPWVIKGVIFSMLKRYHLQNTFADDYWETAMLFYKRLKDRGWERNVLTPMFTEAHQRIVCPDPKPKDAVPSHKKTAILHFEYNRLDIQRRQVRKIWDETCNLLEKDVKDGGLAIERVICAYSRPKNLRDLLQKAKLRENEDHKASSYF